MECENVNILPQPQELKFTYTGEDLNRNRKLALKNTIKSLNDNKKRFDLQRKELQLNVDDLVYAENGSRLDRRKLDELWIGPCRIRKGISNSIYEIDTEKKNRTESNLFHITKLIPIVNGN